jgi:hypothetical protein
LCIFANHIFNKKKEVLTQKMSRRSFLMTLHDNNTSKLNSNSNNYEYELIRCAFNSQFDKCAKILDKLKLENFDRNNILNFIEELRYILFTARPRKFDMLAFQRCCFILYNYFHCPHPFLKVYSKLFINNQIRAQKRIYFWWIPICYNMRLSCGQKMAEKSWENTKLLYSF